METKKTQILTFIVIAVAMGIAASDGLAYSSERYFYYLVVSRALFSLAAFLLLLFIFEKGRSADGSASLLLLAVALSESFIAYLQSDVTGESFLIVSFCLFFSSVLNFVSLRNSLVSMLPGQIAIMSVPFLSLPQGVWGDRLQVTRILILPSITLISSLVIWIFNSVFVHRLRVNSSIRSMKKRQELLQAQILLLKKQPRTLRLPEVHETMRVKPEDKHGTPKQKAVSDHVLLTDLIDSVRECLNIVQAKLEPKKSTKVSLDLPAPMSLPVLIAAEKEDLKKILSSVLAKSVNSLNGDQGVVRIGLRVGFKAVSISIEDNGWGLREKFSTNSDLKHELSLREIQAMVKFWGGRFEVLSRLGVGTRMQLELERVDAYVTDERSERKLTDDIQTQSASHLTAGS